MRQRALAQRDDRLRAFTDPPFVTGIVTGISERCDDAARVGRCEILRAVAAGAGSDPNTRITAVTAVKYAVLASKPDSDSSLQIIAENLSAFVGAAPLTDDDRGVRRAAVQTLSGRGLSLAHTRPRLRLIH